METYLPIGGVVAVGFDSTGAYLLTISHSGRGLFSTKDWTKLARDGSPAYPKAGIGIGIGPIAGQPVAVTEMHFERARFTLASPDGRVILNCESEGISVTVLG